MKKMRKLLAMLLALAMIMGMAVTASAASAGTDGKVGTADDRGILYVKGVEEDDVVVKAYPIAMAQYDANDNFSGYSNPYGVTLTAPTKDELDAINIAAITEGVLTLTYDADNNQYKSAETPVGMYLIDITGAEVTQYSRAVATIYYTNADGTGNSIVEDDLVIAAVAEAPVWAKKSVDIDVEKTVDAVAGTTANIGDVQDYVITIDPIPSYTGEYPVLKVSDVLSAGLTYKNDAVAYVVNGTTETELAETLYTVNFTESTNTLVVNFVVDGEYGLNEYAGMKIAIKYTAELNENAELNSDDNTNTVTLTYTHDSNVEGGEKSNDDTTYVYTFDIDGQTEGNLTEEILTKVIASTETEKVALAGAKFGLYTDADCENLYTNDVFNGTTTSDANGKFKIQGLAAGTYYFKEIEAPEGYSLNTHVYTIVITATINEGTGALESWTITVDEAVSTFTMNGGSAVETTVVETEIPNTQLAALPSTGGIGTTIFTIAGVAIMMAAAYFFFASRRRENA